MNDIKHLYEIRFNADDRKKKDAIWKTLCESFFSRYITSSDTVLDIACGYGEFSNHINAKRKLAIDLNPDTKKFLNSDIEFYLSSADSMHQILSSSVDVCFSSNFFEHLPSKEVMDDVLQEAFRVLKPHGIYIALQPNIRCEPGKYWDYYDHVLPLSHLSCGEAFEKSGFILEELIPKFVPFSTKSRLPNHQGLINLYLRLPFLWNIFGGQFLLIAKKPANLQGVGLT